MERNREDRKGEEKRIFPRLVITRKGKERRILVGPTPIFFSSQNGKKTKGTSDF